MSRLGDGCKTLRKSQDEWTDAHCVAVTAVATRLPAPSTACGLGGARWLKADVLGPAGR